MTVRAEDETRALLVAHHIDLSIEARDHAQAARSEGLLDEAYMWERESLKQEELAQQEELR